jgi:hypothetical protein
MALYMWGKWGKNMSDQKQTSIRGIGRSVPTAVKVASAGLPLDFCLLCYFERVVDLDSEITVRALKLGMPEQQLNGPQVLRAPVDQRCFCSPHRVGAIRNSIQTDRTHPGSDNACVLPGGQVGDFATLLGNEH